MLFNIYFLIIILFTSLNIKLGIYFNWDEQEEEEKIFIFFKSAIFMFEINLNYVLFDVIFCCVKLLL